MDFYVQDLSLTRSKMASYLGVLIVLSILCSKTTSKHRSSKVILKLRTKICCQKTHIPAVKLERDGHINPEFHHEVFLGRLVDEGKLNPKDVDGSKELIKIFHKVDLNNNHKGGGGLIDKSSLSGYIKE